MLVLWRQTSGKAACCPGAWARWSLADPWVVYSETSASSRRFSRGTGEGSLDKRHHNDLTSPQGPEPAVVIRQALLAICELNRWGRGGEVDFVQQGAAPSHLPGPSSPGPAAGGRHPRSTGLSNGMGQGCSGHLGGAAAPAPRLGRDAASGWGQSRGAPDVPRA